METTHIQGCLGATNITLDTFRRSGLQNWIRFFLQYSMQETSDNFLGIYTQNKYRLDEGT